MNFAVPSGACHHQRLRSHLSVFSRGTRNLVWTRLSRIGDGLKMFKVAGCKKKVCYVTGVGVCGVAGKMSGQPWECEKWRLER